METMIECTVTLCLNWYILFYIRQDGRAFHSSSLGVETQGAILLSSVLANFAIVPEDLKQTPVHETLSLGLQLCRVRNHHSLECVRSHCCLSLLRS